MSDILPEFHKPMEQRKDFAVSNVRDRAIVTDEAPGEVEEVLFRFDGPVKLRDVAQALYDCDAPVRGISIWKKPE